MNIIVLDTETTDKEPPMGVVEVAWLKIAYSEEFNEYYIDEDSFETYLVNPEMPIKDGASAKHGIRQEDITPDLPILSEVVFPQEPCVIVCHNVPFDKPLVEKYMNIEHSLCTLQLARRLIVGCENHQLGTLAAYLNLSNQLSHRAHGDIIHTAELLIHMLTKYELSMEDALNYLAKPFVFTSMPWGKHKGKLMSEVPKGYLMWLSGVDLDKDTRATVNYYLTGKI